MATNKIYNVKNRSASMVVYKIPEDGIRREFAPGESKKIHYSELEKLSYQSGGRALMMNFLQITDEDVTNSLNIHTEAEYYMSEEQIIDLIKNGSLDAFLDCLDYAPVGVIDLLKKFAVSLPVTDIEKRQALKAKTGFDVDVAIKNIEAEKFEPLYKTALLLGVAGLLIRRRKIDDIVLYFVFLFSTLSWHILAKAHSYVHTHMNYVLWYFGFVQICIYIIVSAIPNIIIYHKRRKKNGKKDEVEMTQEDM